MMVSNGVPVSVAERVLLPEIGATQESQTDGLFAFPAWFGSPLSRVARTVVALVDPCAFVIAYASAKLSFPGSTGASFAHHVPQRPDPFVSVPTYCAAYS